MNNAIRVSDLDIADIRLRRLLEKIESTTAGSLGISDVLGELLIFGDAAVENVVREALPPGFLPHQLEPLHQHAANPASGGLACATELMQVLARYDSIYRRNPATNWQTLFCCLAEALSPLERFHWHPLDFERLARGCAQCVSSSGGSGQDSTTANTPQSPVGQWTLDNITERVRNAKFADKSPFEGEPTYTAFFDALLRSLHRSAPRHVLLIRERGVAEQAVVMELARRGLKGDPPFLRNKTILYLDCRRLPAEQIRAAIWTIFSSGKITPDHSIVCLEGLVNLLRNRGSEDNRSLLFNELAQAQCRTVGILSPRDYQEHFSADIEAQELFSTVELAEPGVSTATVLTKYFCLGLEGQYQVRICNEAIAQVVALSHSYILNDRLPHKAVKILREICDDIVYERSELGLRRDEVLETDVVAKISKSTGIPEATLAGIGERVDYFAALRAIIVGQDHAVREVATELGLIKAGLVDSGKPASVMLFVGQTGTGKTEMAKALARFYSSSKRLKTFTLGNFSEPHSVAGLIGVPPGYVGHDQGGRLVNELNADPYSVFLLDEADKAHPDVIQPFLNLFDEGWICDQRGVKAYADRAIFILTTNVAQRQIGEMCKQGKSISEITSTAKDLLSRIRHSKSNRPVFSAEFLARIKRIVVFRSLDREAMHGICARLIDNMIHEWRQRRKKTLHVPSELVEHVADKAFSNDDASQGKEGGRIVRKLIADLLETPIQLAIGQSPNEYQKCETVRVNYFVPAKTKEDNTGAASPLVSVVFEQTSLPNFS